MGVVPASAGVFRSPGHPFGGHRGRPRQRGGVPQYEQVGNAVPPSSPPARGCSDLAGCNCELQIVVPASAGVFRTPPGRRRRPGCRPRQRGGVPVLVSEGGRVVGSSPPARGCSEYCRREAARRRVVPASAGVFRGPPWRGGSQVSRPRQRGGVPEGARPSGCLLMSSPPARGCSPEQLHRVNLRVVVPASAGVFRPSSRWCRGSRSRPRQRGGVPCPATTSVARSPSSPPARGCSQPPREPDPASAVVPASAGVFRSPTVARCPGTRRPRQRGGVPRPDPRAAPDRRSSPPARGCSLHDVSRIVSSQVVPASAGVFPVPSMRVSTCCVVPASAGVFPVSVGPCTA